MTKYKIIAATGCPTGIAIPHTQGRTSKSLVNVVAKLTGSVE